MNYPRRIREGLILTAFLLVICFVVNVYGGTFLGKNDLQIQKESGDKTSIVVAYPYDSAVCDFTDLQEVEAAINEITQEEIGVTVELRPVNIYSSYQEYMQWLSRGDTIDLMYIQGSSIKPFIDAGLLQSMSGYLKRDMTYIYIKNQMSQGAITQAATQQGKIYGVADIKEAEAQGYGLWISENILNEAGYNYQPNHIYTYDEIEQIMEKLKEQYPNQYPLAQITATQTGTSGIYYTRLGNSLGDDFYTGVVRNDSDVVENAFTTPEYLEFLSYMNRWYDREYIFDDSAIYTNGAIRLLKTGKVFLYPASSRPDTMDLSLGVDNDYVCLQMVQPQQILPSATQGYWTLPSTSRYASKAAEFLNLLYSSTKVTNLLCYGIQDKHYTIADANVKYIKKTGTGYYFPTASFGAQENRFSYQNKYQQEIAEKYNLQAQAADSRYQGVVMDTSSVIREEYAVNQVVQKYLYVLESGSVDLKQNYQDFLIDLQEAGIDTILQEKQTQLNTWLNRE